MDASDRRAPTEAGRSRHTCSQDELHLVCGLARRLDVCVAARCTSDELIGRDIEPGEGCPTTTITEENLRDVGPADEHLGDANVTSSTDPATAPSSANVEWNSPTPTRTAPHWVSYRTERSERDRSALDTTATTSSVLLVEKLDDLELAAVDPAREHEQQELQRRDRHLRRSYRAEIPVRPAPRGSGERRAVSGERRSMILPDGFHPILCWHRTSLKSSSAAQSHIR
jgi:hypothetical protein